MRRLLVQEDPHRLPRLHSAADHRHQLGFDEVFALPSFPALSAFGAVPGAAATAGAAAAGRRPRGDRGGPSRPGCGGPAAGSGLPARDGDLSVIDFAVRFIGGADVALACGKVKGEG